MYKILPILLLMAVTCTVTAQEKQEKYFSPKPMQIPGVDGKPLSLPNLSVQPGKTDIEKMRKFMTSNADIVYNLPPDNMPCRVQNKDNIEAIPNAFSSQERLPYMPNSLPLSKKSASR